LTTFTRTWNPAYEATPDNSEDALLGAGRIRDLKFDIHERLDVDHSWAGDGNDGLHNQVTLIAEAAPVTPPAGQVVIYLPTGQNAPVIKDSSGNISSFIPTGVIQAFAGASAPAGFLLCQGQAVSRSTYAALFALIGIIYGAGDGSTTFNIPNLQGRFPLGISGSHALTTTGGEENHTLTLAESPLHNHTINIQDPTHSHTQYPTTVWLGGSAVFASGGPQVGGQGGQTAAAATGITATSLPVGGGAAHNNMPPFLSLNFIIKT
jgi:microcystin-dependent protein